MAKFSRTKSSKNIHRVAEVDVVKRELAVILVLLVSMLRCPNVAWRNREVINRTSADRLKLNNLTQVITEKITKPACMPLLTTWWFWNCFNSTYLFSSSSIAIFCPLGLSDLRFDQSALYSAGRLSFKFDNWAVSRFPNLYLNQSIPQLLEN